MNTVSRGIRNAFRNITRTFSLVIILGVSIGLSLVMLIANQTVSNKISSVKSSIGNTITIAPAGYSGFSQVNNSLTTSQLSKVSSLPHITNVAETLTDRLTAIGQTSSFGNFGQSSSSSNDTTSLTSPVNLNKISNKIGGRAKHLFISGGGSLPTNFSLPISIVGTNDPTSINGSNITINSGSGISGSSDSNDALVSSSMASKNNLKVGSTFTAYGTTLTVSGIFKVSTQSGDNDIIVSLPTEQRLSNQNGDVTSAVATVDSLDNLSSATSAVKSTLGSSADVTSSVEQANDTIQPLNSVKNISLYSLIGAVVAGSVIILLTMIMIVRERRREIGVIKAIGASNIKVISQFMSEAITLTLLGSIIGLIIGVFASSPVTRVLVNNSSSTSTTITSFNGRSVRLGGGAPGGGGAGGTAFRGTGVGRAFDVKAVQAVVGWEIIVYGIIAALVIAIIGSIAASLLIAKIRPAEVMRVE